MEEKKSLHVSDNGRWNSVVQIAIITAAIIGTDLIGAHLTKPIADHYELQQTDVASGQLLQILVKIAAGVLITALYIICQCSMNGNDIEKRVASNQWTIGCNLFLLCSLIISLCGTMIVGWFEPSTYETFQWIILMPVSIGSGIFFWGTFPMAIEEVSEIKNNTGAKTVLLIFLATMAPIFSLCAIPLIRYSVDDPSPPDDLTDPAYVYRFFNVYKYIGFYMLALVLIVLLNFFKFLFWPEPHAHMKEVEAKTKASMKEWISYFLFLVCVAAFSFAYFGVHNTIPLFLQRVDEDGLFLLDGATSKPVRDLSMLFVGGDIVGKIFSVISCIWLRKPLMNVPIDDWLSVLHSFIGILCAGLLYKVTEYPSINADKMGALLFFMGWTSGFIFFSNLIFVVIHFTCGNKYMRILGLLLAMFLGPALLLIEKVAGVDRDEDGLNPIFNFAKLFLHILILYSVYVLFNFISRVGFKSLYESVVKNAEKRFPSGYNMLRQMQKDVAL